MPALPAAARQLYCTHLYHYGRRGVGFLDAGGLKTGIILPLVFYCNILILLLSRFLQGIAPLSLWQSPCELASQRIFNMPKPLKGFFFSCERYWDCNLPVGDSLFSFVLVLFTSLSVVRQLLLTAGSSSESANHFRRWLPPGFIRF